MDWFTAGNSVTELIALALILLAGFTSFVTASMGVGGGVLLLAVMTTLVPVAALIPIHGLVQLGSNANRAFLTRKHIDRSLLLWFTTGAIVGSVVGSFMVIQLPVVVIEFTVGGFILFLVWGGKPKARESTPIARFLVGVFTTFLSLFVGATGPLVAGFIQRAGSPKLVMTATFASCMTLQNILKATVFSVAGFAFFQWLPLILLMIASGFAGTWLGLKMLDKIPEARFQIIFRILITALALRLIVQAVISLDMF